MKKETIDFLRNVAHGIIGLTFAYKLGNATGLYGFALYQQIFGILFIGILSGLLFSVPWEFGNLVVFGIKPSEKDIKITVALAIIGIGLSCFFQNIEFITFWMFYGSIALIVVDLIRATIKKYKN